MTPYVLDRVVSSLPQKSSTSLDMVSETEAGSVRDGSIGSREDSSIISFNGKPKPAVYKRVSFGSSKGSMVETVIFDNEIISPHKHISHSSSNSYPREEHIQLMPPAKVRVTFYESQKPHYVTTPDSSEFSFNLMTLQSTMASADDVQRYISMNTGKDNPFRPEGELSREAESLVKQVQAGQPFASSTPVDDNTIEKTILQENMASPKSTANSIQDMPSTSPSIVEIQHGIVVPPASPSNVEQIMIKKKPKCHCCVIL